MTTEQPRDETRQHFDADLEGLKRETVQLGAMVLENVKRLTEAVSENRLDLAEDVVDADDEIDERYAELERKTFRLIALQQPVAGDLRFLVSITRILYEIERSGDLAVNSAKGLMRQHGYALDAAMRSVLARLCGSTVELFGKGLDALDAMDVAAGVGLDEEDDVVDDLVSDLYALISTTDMDVDTAVELSRSGRYMERIADHAVNIGDHIAFIVTGSFPRSVTAGTGDEE